MVTIEFRAIVEVLGKPQPHVEKMLDSILTRLKEDSRFKLKAFEKHECVPQGGTDLFATFMEVDVTSETVENMIGFCFDFMPSSIEINKPHELQLSCGDFSQFLNDLQAKLHQVDMLAKKMKMERDIGSKNTSGLLKNYLLVLLTTNKLTISQLSGYTGVNADKLADYLDILIDEGKIDLTGELYSRIKR